MNLSAILVVVAPSEAENAVVALNDLSGVEVHHQDENGRLIVVQEASCIDDEVAGLRRIQALPWVICADLVYHYFAEGDSIGECLSPAPDEATGIANPIST